MNIWSDFFQALGQDESGSFVDELRRKIGEQPLVSKTPDSYNDPEGRTEYFKFIKSGMEFGFRLGKLNHIHFFVQPHEGYSADLLDRLAKAWSVQEVIAELGLPDEDVPSRVDMLIGHIPRWLRYNFESMPCVWS